MDLVISSYLHIIKINKSSIISLFFQVKKAVAMGLKFNQVYQADNSIEFQTRRTPLRGHIISPGYFGWCLFHHVFLSPIKSYMWPGIIKNDGCKCTQKLRICRSDAITENIWQPVFYDLNSFHFSSHFTRHCSVSTGNESEQDISSPNVLLRNNPLITYSPTTTSQKESMGSAYASDQRLPGSQMPQNCETNM